MITVRMSLLRSTMHVRHHIHNKLSRDQISNWIMIEVSESSSHDNDTNVTAEKHDACSPSHSQQALESSNQQLDNGQVVTDNQSIFAAKRILGET